MVTTFSRPGCLRRALDTGAAGFVVKIIPVARLAEAVRRAHVGLRTVDPQFASDLLFSDPNPLTVGEQGILCLARGGEPIAKLVRRLFSSPGAVRNHSSNTIGKAGVANRVEAVRITTERGWL